MEEAGTGALRRAFDALKNRLQAEGLFDARQKRSIPTLPRRIGIITSPTGAAVLIRCWSRVREFERAFAAIGPQATLERGYAILLGTDGVIVRETRQVKDDERLHARLVRGELDLEVVNAEPER